MKTTLAWHFVGDTLRDGRPVPPDGETLVHEGPLVLCRSGLHASRRIMDALRYAPGFTICRVQMEGYEDGGDKIVGRRRTILWRVEGEEILRDFARRCALDVVHLWDPPDVVVEYLRTGGESLRDAVRDADWDAVSGTAEAAAREAAWNAASSCAWGAAGAAAEAVARDASEAVDCNAAASWSAGTAAWNAARDRQNRRLTAMVSAARRGAEPVEGELEERPRCADCDSTPRSECCYPEGVG